MIGILIMVCGVFLIGTYGVAYLLGDEYDDQ